MTDTMLVACDGSCLKNPNGPTGWAWAAEDGSYAHGGLPSGTNNIGELLAVINTLTDWSSHHLTIQIDSQYAMNASTKWVQGWKKKGWKNSKGETIANIDLIQQIDELMRDRAARRLRTDFVWVKGHRTDNAYPLNTLADELAGVAARTLTRSEDVRHFPADRDLYATVGAGGVEPLLEPKIDPYDLSDF